MPRYVGCVDATPGTEERDMHATSPVRLRADVFDERCQVLGILTEVAKAELVEVDRTTLHRLRRGSLSPRLEVAMRFASALNLKVEDLWEEVPS